MTTRTMNRMMRIDATCSICQQLMTEPTCINCGHSFCKSCILGHIRKKLWPLTRNTGVCPLCQTQFNSKSLRPNKQLQSLIEAMKEMDRKYLCKEHGEQLQLFCEEEGRLICWCCERLPQHKGHAILLVTEACQVYKKKLQETVQKLRELDVKNHSMKILANEHITECVENITSQKQKVQNDFKNFKRYLDEMEKSYLCTLDENKEKLFQRLQDSLIILEKQDRQLKKYIVQLEKRLQGSAEMLLQDVKDTLKRSSTVAMKLPETVSLNLDMLCNVSELNFDVKKIATSYQDLSTKNKYDVDSTNQMESKTDSFTFGSITEPFSADLAVSNSEDFSFDSNNKNFQGASGGATVFGTQATNTMGENVDGSDEQLAQNENTHFEPIISPEVKVKSGKDEEF